MRRGAIQGELHLSSAILEIVVDCNRVHAALAALLSDKKRLTDLVKML